jgi:hypothetical protein
MIHIIFSFKMQDKYWLLMKNRTSIQLYRIDFERVLKELFLMTGFFFKFIPLNSFVDA